MRVFCAFPSGIYKWGELAFLDVEVSCLPQVVICLCLRWWLGSWRHKLQVLLT